MSEGYDGGRCLRRACDGRYRLVATMGRERLFVCDACEDWTGYQPLSSAEPMPSERGIPVAELLDAAERPARTLGEIVRRARDRDRDGDR